MHGKVPVAGTYLRVERLDKQFAAHGRFAFKEISFEVPKGQFLALIGPSGCGKSTLLHIMSGLSPATSGQVSLIGEPVTEPRADMMFVFQQYTKSIFPWKTVLDNVMLAIKYRSSEPKAAQRELAQAQLELVGLGRYASYHPYQLSGGMQQRVAIARALARRPQILLMDEPFAALDAQTKIEARAVFLKIWEERRRSVVFVTHDLSEALLLGDRIVMLATGGREVVNLKVPFAHPRDVSELPFTREFRELEHELSQKLL